MLDRNSLNHMTEENEKNVFYWIDIVTLIKQLLFFFVYWYIKFCGLFKAKAILIEKL